MPTVKLGRRPLDKKTKANYNHSLKLRKIIRRGVKLPPVPASVDYLPLVADGYPMYLNDVWGTCVSASAAHEVQLNTVVLLGQEVRLTDADIAAFYATQNPGFDPSNPNSPDGGMDMGTAWKYLNQNGWPGHPDIKPIAYATVALDKASIEAAAAIFGSVQLGFNVQQAQMDEFNSGQPWSYVPGSPNIGGHCIPEGGYTADRGKVVTWATEYDLMDNMISSGLVEEAWVLVYPWHLGTKQFQSTIDLTALADAYLELTGNPLPIPTPTPTPPPPTPTPTPTPTPPGPGCIPGVIAAIVAWFKSIFG